MKKIIYSPQFDFIYYAHTIANYQHKKEHIEREIRNKAMKFSKEAIKAHENYFEEAKAFRDGLSFMHKNTLNLFFKEIEIIVDFMMYLVFKTGSFDQMTIENFKSFLAKMCEKNNYEVPEGYDATLEVVKEHYASPESIVDIERTTRLIIDILKDPTILEESVYHSIRTLYESFYEEKVTPKLDTINEVLERHQKLLNDHQDDFIKVLTNNKLDPSEINSKEMDPMLTYFSPYNLFISISHKKYVYSYNLESAVEDIDPQAIIQPLLKFLSDPKRYQMIQMLSQKKWYANELAKEFNITAATMSYHINKLYGLGIIHFEQGEQNKLYIELDKNRLQELMTQMQNDLLK